VDVLQELSELCVHAFIQDFGKALSRLLVAQLWKEAVVKLAQDFVVVVRRKARHAGINHHIENVQNQVAAVSQVQEGIDCLLLKSLVAF
jgi:uncharacterized membrane protein